MTKGKKQPEAVIADVAASTGAITTGPESPRINTAELPFETAQLRAELARFLKQKYQPKGWPKAKNLGSVKCGVYAFYDYDGEPIYVGQTKESLGTRIRRHLTNQRTDSVAMSVLDPLEVHTVEVWPLPEFQDRAAKNPEATDYLNSLEYAVFTHLLAGSTFNAVLNEKLPVASSVKVKIGESLKATVVSADVSRLRDHPDLRIARRAMTLAKLAQVISARKVQRGLRRTLLAQATRLQILAQRRYDNAAEISEKEAD